MSKDLGAFGLVYQNVMRSQKLSVEAKAIYAYLASMADKNSECYPSRQLMANDLKMGIHRLDKNMAMLIGAGVIEKTGTVVGNLKSRNIYKIKHKILESENDGSYFRNNQDGTVRYSEHRNIENSNSEHRNIENRNTNNNNINNKSLNNNRLNNNSAPAPQDAEPADSGEWKVPEIKPEPLKKQISLEDADIDTPEGYAVIKEAYKGYVRRYYSGIKITDRDIRNWWDLRKDGYDFIPTGEE